MWGKTILIPLMHFWNHCSVHCNGIFTQVKICVWINSHRVKQERTREVCHSLTKAGPAKAEGRGNSWCPSLTREGCGISLLLLLFSFPYYLSHSLTCLYFPLPPTSCPHFSISFLASFFYLFFLVFLLSLLLFLPLTVCPLSSLCLWPYHWLHFEMDLKTSHFSNLLGWQKLGILFLK